VDQPKDAGLLEVLAHRPLEAGEHEGDLLLLQRPDQLGQGVHAGGVDVVGEADERMPSAAGSRASTSVRPRPGSSMPGRPGGISPTTATPSEASPMAADAAIGLDHDQQRAGDLGGAPAKQQQRGQTGHPDGQGDAAQAADLPGDLGQLGKRVADSALLGPATLTIAGSRRCRVGTVVAPSGTPWMTVPVTAWGRACRTCGALDWRSPQAIVPPTGQAVLTRKR
jgi:hypothetical protein